MTHSLKLTLASAMAQNPDLEAPAPQIQANASNPDSRTVEGERRTTGQAGASEAISVHFKSETSALADTLDAAFARGMALGAELERERVRGIVLKHFGNDWAGNAVLEEVGK